MNIATILSKLTALSTNETFFGPQGFSIITNEAEHEDYQHQYAKAEANLDESERTWQQTWLVIGQDVELGDPYFVDIANKSLPVYTAVFVDGAWVEELVATSITGFTASLNFLTQKSQQKMAAMIPEEKTISDAEELNRIKRQLIKLSKTDAFWHMFFDCYLDWLCDDDFDDDD